MQNTHPRGPLRPCLSLRALSAAALLAAVPVATWADDGAAPGGGEPSVVDRTAGAVKHGATVAASATTHGVKVAASAAEHGVKRAVSATEYGLKKAASGVELGARKTGEVVHDVARKIGLPTGPASSTPAPVVNRTP